MSKPFRAPLLLITIMAVLHSALAEPTEEREWRSTAGTTLRARATALEAGQVRFTTSGGRNLSVPLDKLIPEDATYLQTHFKEPLVEIPPRAVPSGLPHALGEVVGPIQTGDSSYFLYLPTTLVEDRQAPLLFFTGPGGGTANICKNFSQAAELNGCIIGVSKESRNGIDSESFIEANIKHLLATLPIDPKRVYSAGVSGGGIRALRNNHIFDGAGVIPIVAHGIIEPLPSKKSDYHFISGATDYNRTGTGYLRKHCGKSAFTLVSPERPQPRHPRPRGRWHGLAQRSLPQSAI